MYDKKRPYIPADIKRQLLTGAGHRCSLTRCLEHIVEIHHIDGNRENNDINNLVVLCDKHHKLAHQGTISRKDLFEYKRMLVSQVNPEMPLFLNDHDRNLLCKINDLFTYDIIQQIKNEPFGRTVPKNIFQSIDL